MLTNIDKHTHRSWDSDVIVNDGGTLDMVVKESDLETKPVVWLKLGRAIVRPARAWPMLSFDNIGQSLAYVIFFLLIFLLFLVLRECSQSRFLFFRDLRFFE